jgi:hypothetical protein
MKYLLFLTFAIVLISGCAYIPNSFTDQIRIPFVSDSKASKQSARAGKSATRAASSAKTEMENPLPREVKVKRMPELERVSLDSF